MTVCRRAAIDRFVQLQGAADVGRCEPEHLGQNLLELALIDLPGSVRFDQNRHWIGDANRIGNLDGATLSETRRDNVLGEITRGISGGAIDLGWVLAREGAAAVWCIAAVSVHDDLAAGEPAVAIRPPDHE